MLGDAPLCLTDEVKAAILGQVSEVANEVRDRMLVARAAMLLKSCHGFRGPAWLPSLQPLVPPEILNPRPPD